MLALLDHEVFGIEGLPRGGSRTVDRASAAFETRCHIEQLLPGILLDPRDTERFRSFEVLDGDEPFARAKVSKKQIDRSDEKVAELRKWKREQQTIHE
jgi:hypothetical protein